MPVLGKPYDPAIYSILEDKDVQTEIETLANGKITSNMAVAIMKLEKDGTETFSSSGATLLGADGKKPDADTLFKIGSVTKPFGAATILHLSNKGAFGPDGIDTKISDKIDEWSEVIEKKYADEPNVQVFRNLLTNNIREDATLRDAIQHKSGMADFELRDFSIFNSANGESGLPYLKQDDNAPIKEGFSYSNPMYMLLGMIIEAETGKNLDDVIREEVFDRYNLSNTFTTTEYLSLADEEKSKYNAATSYHLADDGKLYKLFELNHETLAANMITSPRDLSTFLQAIADDPVLEPMANGVGMFSNIKIGEQEWVGHTGGGGGAGILAAAAYIQPETRESFVIMATRTLGLETDSCVSMLHKFDYEGKDDDIKKHVKKRVEEFLEEQGLPTLVKEIEPDNFTIPEISNAREKLKKEIVAIEENRPLPDVKSAEHDGTLTDKNKDNNRRDR